MAVEGHEALLDILHNYLPPASLFLGPHSVGRWKVAEHLRWYHGVHEDDVLRIRRLDMEAVDTLRQFCLTRPVNGPFKLAIVELYKASRGAQVALTSLLEKPMYARIIVIAQPNEALPGIYTRCSEFTFRYLREHEVANVLISKMNFGPERAKKLAGRAGGQISKALQLADAETTISVVRRALAALRAKDEAELAELATEWSDEATAWLQQWCHETLSQQWRVFDHEDYVAGRALPIRILMATEPRVRPRLVVRSQLMSVLRGE